MKLIKKYLSFYWKDRPKIKLTSYNPIIYSRIQVGESS